MGSLNLYFQSPSEVDFIYVGMVTIFIVIAYRMSKLKGNLGLFRNSALVFFPLYSVVGYFFFFSLKV